MLPGPSRDVSGPEATLAPKAANFPWQRGLGAEALSDATGPLGTSLPHRIPANLEQLI